MAPADLEVPVADPVDQEVLVDPVVFVARADQEDLGVSVVRVVPEVRADDVPSPLR
jgi:hypothetical protein